MRRRFDMSTLVKAVTLLALAGGGLAGCAASGLVNQWSDPTFHQSLTNVFVIAVKKDEVNRRITEDAFVNALDKQGVKATASYTVFPNELPPDTLTVRDKVHEGGYDGVVVISRLTTQKVTEEIPGYATSEVRTRYDNWANRYHTYYVQVQHDATTETQRIVRHRVDVWLVGNPGRMVYTVEGRSVDPTSVSQVSKEMSSDIVPAIAKAGLLPQKK